ncbi:probable CoA ligase CCL5 isoform X2 [Magnolia sinica]|uniref:probable CoA ligase CCL5 isoform X2 n=1 Tax=Magnolia sinica TaxID=86752 RepID=UPI0026582C00|nr:probable CoA ligase CCL5 isoform X2 [Magnolia sinica]
MAHDSTSVDPRSGFCSSNSTFYSKRKPITLPSDDFLDITTFISSRLHSGKTAFIDALTGRHVTFPDLWRAVGSVATCLSLLGVRKGHVILILSANSIYFPIAVFAVMSIGAIVTTANTLNTPREIARQMADSKPILAFVTRSLLSKLGQSTLPIVLLPDREHGTAIEGVQIVSNIEEMMAQEPSRDRVRERVRPDDPATMLYSSGTTGTSKGVVSTHRNLMGMVETCIGRFRLEDGAQTFISTIPMFHVYGLTIFAVAVPASGSTTVVIPRFEMDAMLSAIEKYHVTYLPLVPPILMALARQADTIRARYELGSLKTVLTGGAPLSKEVMEGFWAKYPTVAILQGYAMTETTGVGTSTDSVEESGRYGSAGLLASGMEARVVDPDGGQALGVNRTGELWLRGPCVMKGYFNNPEATGSTLDSNGWLRTGDVCYMDEDGYMFVVDRLKELIKYKGYQVAPAELEALLVSHNEITDAAVIPWPHTREYVRLYLWMTSRRIHLEKY